MRSESSVWKVPLCTNRIWKCGWMRWNSKICYIFRWNHSVNVINFGILFFHQHRLIGKGFALYSSFRFNINSDLHYLLVHTLVDLKIKYTRTQAQIRNNIWYIKMLIFPIVAYFWFKTFDTGSIERTDYHYIANFNLFIWSPNLVGHYQFGL